MQRNILERFGKSFCQAPQAAYVLPRLYLSTAPAAPASQTTTSKNTNTKIENKNPPPRKAKTPIEKEPLPPFPNNTNPITGEIGGPRGPEPTRYGDWERKGRVTDF